MITRLGEDGVTGDKNDWSDVSTPMYVDWLFVNISEDKGNGGELVPNIQALRERPRDVGVRIGAYGHRCVPAWKEKQRERKQQKQRQRNN